MDYTTTQNTPTELNIHEHLTCIPTPSATANTPCYRTQQQKKTITPVPFTYAGDTHSTNQQNKYHGSRTGRKPKNAKRQKSLFSISCAVGSKRESHRLVLRLLHRTGGAFEPRPVSRQAAHARPENRVAALQEHRRVIQRAACLMRFTASEGEKGSRQGKPIKAEPVIRRSQSRIPQLIYLPQPWNRRRRPRGRGGWHIRRG